MLKKIKEKWNTLPLTVKVSAAYAICSILQKCLSFITLPLFTRLLSTEQYGQFTVYNSWSGIFSIFLTLNLAYGSFSTAMVKFEDRKNEYIASVEGIFLVLTAIFLLMYLPFQNLWNRFLELPSFLVILLVFEVLTGNSILLWNGKKRFEYRYKEVIAVTLASSVIAPATAFIFVINTEEKGYARIIGYAITTVIIGGIFFFYNLAKGKMLYNREFWKYAFGFNIPLIIYYLSQAVFNQSDRIMISHYCGPGQAAIYGVAYNLAWIMGFVISAVNNSYVPWFYKKIKEGKQNENKNVSCMIAALMAGLILGVIWFAPEIICIMAGSEYYNAIYVVPPIAMSLLFLFYTQLFTNVDFYYEEKSALNYPTIAAAVINIILNAVLIPRAGYIAAGYTTLASYIILTITAYLGMKLILKKKGITKDGYNLKGLAAIMALFIAAGFLALALYRYLILRTAGAAAALAIVFAFRRKISGYLKMIRKTG